jgi:DNA-directed RNA polymerase specialized sigma24 family protein
MWTCRLCSKSFEEIPDDAILLSPRGHRRHSCLYRFGGVVHDLREIKQKTSEVSAQPEPPVQVELLQEVVAALAELPEPQPEIIMDPEIEDESESESVTAMAAAFKRIQKDS